MSRFGGVALAVAAVVGAAGVRAASAPQEHSRGPPAQVGVPSPDAPFVARSLTRHERRLADGLLRTRYPCLGCHVLDGDGGRIGPDLSAVGARRSPADLYAMIRDPARTVPGTVMPPHPMPDARAALLANYLASRDRPAREQARRVPAGAPVPDSASGAALYARYCAACHGAGGDGAGPNARFLPVRPTAHADAATMAPRPDATLYDGIHAGGRVLGRHHRMPAFGGRLSDAAIRRIVAHLRTLCGCTQPTWAADGIGS